MEQKLFFSHPSGIKLCGILNDADMDKRTPIIIIVHGFISSKDSKSYIPLVRNLTKAKIATFRIDLFGHGESEGDFSEITITKGKDSVLAAIKFIKAKGYLKIGLLGSSFGGISSIIASSQTKDLFCLGLKAPVTDWLKISFPSRPGVLEKWQKQGCINYGEHEDYQPKLKYGIVEDAKKQIAFNVAHKIAIPTLVVHGDEDDIVPYEGTEKFVKMLSNGFLHTITGANHRFTNKDHFNEMTAALTKFFIDESEKLIN